MLLVLFEKILVFERDAVRPWFYVTKPCLMHMLIEMLAIINPKDCVKTKICIKLVADYMYIKNKCSLIAVVYVHIVPLLSFQYHWL